MMIVITKSKPSAMCFKSPKMNCNTSVFRYRANVLEHWLNFQVNNHIHQV